MKNSFNVAEAKSKFSEVLHRADIAPQFISNRGKKISVIISKKSYDKLLEIESKNQPRARIKEFLEYTQDLRTHFPNKLPWASRKSRPSPDFT